MAVLTRTQDRADLATSIHDDVLQSLGVAVLGIDLCRLFHERARYEQALDELTGISDALASTLATAERLLPELRLAVAIPARSFRPNLVLAAATAAEAATVTPIAGPDEIVLTLDACRHQAERCRRAYDAGLAADTLDELGLLLQRLEFVALAFRQIMALLCQSVPRAVAVRTA
ncbi:MAG: hypothetical protein IT305_22655 [Chloroflexi bacterium]|nr:hypothetical protein [Chloroflexota bacterium]